MLEISGVKDFLIPQQHVMVFFYGRYFLCREFSKMDVSVFDNAEAQTELQATLWCPTYTACILLGKQCQFLADQQTVENGQ